MSNHRTTSLLLYVLATLMVMTRTAWAHPKPGAHADIRITVTPTGVRMDLLMNLMFVDALVKTTRADMDGVSPAEEPALHDALRQYFGGVSGTSIGLEGTGAGLPLVLDRPNVLRIDGFVVAPIEREFTVIRPEPETRPGFEQNPLMLIPQVQVTLEYACKSPPRQVELVWGTFPRDFLAAERFEPPPVTVEAILVSNQGTEQLVLTQAEPSYTWHLRADNASPIRPPPSPHAARDVPSLPAASAALAAAWVLGAGISILRRRDLRAVIGALLMALPACAAAYALLPLARIPLRAPEPPPTAAEMIEVFGTLHANIYRAFDYTTEDQIYDALAQSVSGNLLDTLYSQIYTSLVMFEEGGAVSRVKQLTPVETVVVRPATNEVMSFQVRSRWRVEGIVHHWGHSHTRLNEYVALYDVAAAPGGWRIVGVTPEQQFRVDPSGTPSPDVPAAREATDTWHPNR